MSGRQSGVSDAPVIHWMNHASYLLASGSTGMLVAPWFSGTAFNDGWSLLSPSADLPDDLPFTHLWISHEHPDHFSPRDLAAIPVEVRAEVTAMYQYTRDHRVVDFLRGLGFAEVIELPPERVEVAPGIEVLCRPWPAGDSFLVTRMDDRTIVNLNDCAIDTDGTAETIRQAVDGPVDVLLTQFSYANWVGNPEEVELRRRHASKKLEWVERQIQVLAPTWVVPFASFVWFSHEENHYLNDEVNTVGSAVEAIEARTEAIPVVLYPGDRWRIGNAHDASSAVARYEQDHGHTRGRPLTSSTSVGFEVLESAAAECVAELVSVNGRVPMWFAARVGLVPPVSAWLIDHGTAVELSSRGLRQLDAPRTAVDIEMWSSSLLFALQHGFGASALMINGRFRAPQRGVGNPWVRWCRLRNLNTRGSTLLEVPMVVLRRFARMGGIRRVIADRVPRPSS
ncbi:MAG: MBL fold metallo-hydrolase [Acidimicrobiales bacterium]|nr:MBL fold metallo-hydrolase [Acidimicrobiales bacterium]